jgi:hypothetical protein
VSRAAARALVAALAVLAPACSRPPKGMRRLDSGDSNHRFRIDASRRHLFYIEGGDLIATRLGVVDLETGRRSSYRFSPEHIVAIQPSLGENAVTVAVESADDAGEGNYQLLKVDTDSGRVLLRKPSEALSKADIVNFGGSAPVEAQAVGGARPGIKVAALNAGRRSTTFFPTPTEPGNVLLSPNGEIYASSLAPDGHWKVEELDPANGARRTVASFAGEVESMAHVGHGLAVLRTGDGGAGPRVLAMVDAVAGQVELELPWSDGESEILGADTAKRLLYIRMNEGESQTCWAIQFDEAGLRAASAYLAAARAPDVRKLTNTDVMGLIIVGGMLLVMTAVLAGASN